MKERPLSNSSFYVIIEQLHDDVQKIGGNMTYWINIQSSFFFLKLCYWENIINFSLIKHNGLTTTNLGNIIQLLTQLNCSNAYKNLITFTQPFYWSRSCQNTASCMRHTATCRSNNTQETFLSSTLPYVWVLFRRFIEYFMCLLALNRD